MFYFVCCVFVINCNHNTRDIFSPTTRYILVSNDTGKCVRCRACARSELYDVLVNVDTKEINIAPHAKGLLLQPQVNCFASCA